MVNLEALKAEFQEIFGESQRGTLEESAAKANSARVASRLSKLRAQAKSETDSDKKDKIEKEIDTLSDTLKNRLGKKDKKKSAVAKKAKKSTSSSSSGGSAPSTSKASGSAAGGAKTHSPFKRRSNLGPGPKGRHHDETKYWKCSCPDGAYKKCKCIGKKGEKKMITIKKGYHRAYNKIYHKWRAGQGGAVTGRQGGKASG